MRRRFFALCLAAGLSTLFLFVVFQNLEWQRLPQTIGLGESYGPTEEEKANALPDLRGGRPHDDKVGFGLGAVNGFREPKIEANSPYAIGATKPEGSNYTKCLVIPRLKRESTNWIGEELGDMLDSGLLTQAVYVVDDRTAPLHPPRNKGHEVMVYLSYIIDHYDGRLADVNIFMHAHRFAWHNNELLATDASLMVRHLRPERVARDGYMNLRCHWVPGCPSWLHPGATERDADKQEEWLIADSWAELFPLDPIPVVLSQPCCAQFAVSKERILALPLQRYVGMRDWLLRTELSDYLSGRVFEYLWQFIFTASSIHCPSMNACYCDGYGLCFGSAENFDHWFELRFTFNDFKEELRVWEEQAEMIEEARRQGKDGRVEEEAPLQVPQVGRDNWLRRKLQKVGAEMDRLVQEAWERGKNAGQRAQEEG